MFSPASSGNPGRVRYHGLKRTDRAHPSMLQCTLKIIDKIADSESKRPGDGCHRADQESLLWVVAEHGASEDEGRKDPGRTRSLGPVRQVLLDYEVSWGSWVPYPDFSPSTALLFFRELRHGTVRSNFTLARRSRPSVRRGPSKGALTRGGCEVESPVTTFPISRPPASESP